MFVLKQISLETFKDIFMIHSIVFLIPPSDLELRDIHILFQISVLMQEQDMVYFYHKILDKLMYLNNLFYKSCSVCVCRSSILFIFMLNSVNLLGVFLDCLSKSHRLVFHIDLH